MQTVTREALLTSAGETLPVTDWFTITQSQIDNFADCTHDHQFIHVDAEKAARTPFGSTIAHGFLSLSMLSYFAQSFGLQAEGAVMGINYGLNKVRFISPVKVDSRIRCHASVAEVSQPNPQQIFVTYDITIELEGCDKPALIAQWIGVQVIDNNNQQES